MSFLIVFLLVSMFLIFIKSQISNIVISKVCNYSLITSVLDTNVYATASQTLSCKIDKTAPESTARRSQYYSAHFADFQFSDSGGSGMAKVTAETAYNTGSDKNVVMLNGTWYPATRLPQTIAWTSNVTYNGSWTLHTGSSNTSDYCTATIVFIDQAGNQSKYNYRYSYNGTPSCTKSN